jgi:hypothetical protein
MTRRRLILAACVAVVALGAAWWLFVERLTAEERLLVGVWRPETEQPNAEVVWEFRGDRSFQCTHTSKRKGMPSSEAIYAGRWYVKGDDLFTDFEDSFFRRYFRPVARMIGMRGRDLESSRVESLTADRIVFVFPGDTRRVLIRDRGD